MKLLVLVQNYPNNDGSVALMYVHTRNVQYAKNGIEVTVLNFSATKEYCYQGIRVIPLEKYAKENEEYDLLVLHAPNLRSHYRFLKRYGQRFPGFLFFFHGHEVLRINSVYSKPYPYVRVNGIKRVMQDAYDSLKLWVWRHYLPRIAEKSFFIFVSQWMRDEFLKWTRVPFQLIAHSHAITYNCIGESFEKNSYDDNCPKEYDFLTIRSNLDGSKYSIDIVNDLAKANPQMKFLVIGKGEFFNHYSKAENLVWENRTLNHREIVEAMQRARCALMPTRTDAQGLMMCELASAGMPLITSDIPVCHEVFDEFENVAMICNDQSSTKLETIIRQLEAGLPYWKNEKYYNRNTSSQEIHIIKKMYSLRHR